MQETDKQTESTQLRLTRPLDRDLDMQMLNHAFRNQRLAHSLLFHGDHGSGADALALHTMRMLLCESDGEIPCNQCTSCTRTSILEHPDIQIIFPIPSTAVIKNIQGDHPEGGEISVSGDIISQHQEKAANHYHRMHVERGDHILIEQIRALRSWAGKKSFEGGNRVVLIFEADRMNLNAQNALLKLAEEPPPGLYLLFTARQPDRLLPTIISRTQQFRHRTISADTLHRILLEMGKPEADADRLARQCEGDVQRLQDLLNNEDHIGQVVDLLRYLLGNDPRELIRQLRLWQAELDHQAFGQRLSMMLRWFRDIIVWQQTGIVDRLYYPDMLDTTRRFAAAFYFDDEQELLQTIDYYIDLAHRNLYFATLLHSFVFDIKRLILPVSEPEKSD